VAATNCLNFGNPEKPEIMAQLSEAIDGIAEACTALGTPITGGNVSLYNETRGEGIYPTPVIGIVGILDDVTKAVPADFQREGDAVVLISSSVGMHTAEGFGSSEYAKTLLRTVWGTPPPLSLSREAELHQCLVALASDGLLHSAKHISDGGLAVAAAEATFRHGIGASLALQNDGSIYSLFGEEAGAVLATCDPSDFELVQQLVGQYGSVSVVPLGTTGGAKLQISAAVGNLISEDVAILRSSWSGALQSALSGDVVTA
jgi:phosphoribosylformylglycinamidine synthase